MAKTRQFFKKAFRRWDRERPFSFISINHRLNLPLLIRYARPPIISHQPLLGCSIAITIIINVVITIFLLFVLVIWFPPRPSFPSYLQISCICVLSHMALSFPLPSLPFSSLPFPYLSHPIPSLPCPLPIIQPFLSFPHLPTPSLMFSALPFPSLPCPSHTFVNSLHLFFSFRFVFHVAFVWGWLPGLALCT